MIPVVVFISGNGSNLQKLIDECHLKTIEIVCVISDEPDAYGLERARVANIGTLVARQLPSEDREAYSGRLADLTNVFSPELVIFAGFMKIMKPVFVNAFTIVNIHPSLLPKFPGLNTHQRALDAGETVHGITIHLVDEGVDTGRILHQAKCPIYPEDNAESLEHRVHHLEHLYYPKVIDELVLQIQMDVPDNELRFDYDK